MDADAQTQPTLPGTDEPSRRRRVRDFRRGYHACELCRKKKIRCIVDQPGASCLRCQREVKECVFSDERSHRKRNKNANRRASSEQGSEHGTAMASTSPAQANLSQDPFTHDPSQVFDDSNDLPLPDISLSVSDGLAHELPQRQQQAVMDETSPSISSTGPAGEITTTLVSNGNDALRLLYQPAIKQANKEGTSPSNQGPTTRHTLHRGAETSSPGTTASVMTSRPNHIFPVSLSPLTVWRAFRFVRMGWFTAEEAVNYIDLFQKNLAPLSPVSRGFDLSHGRHYKLITQEPLLCCVILMISSRYHVLSGHGGLARSTIVHHRLWEHCQHLVMRIIFGQEKRSKAKTRTRGSIEALLLIIEWHPQAIHLPPASDGWDSSTLLTDFDPRDNQFDNQADTADENEAQWLRDVILPAKTSDRMSWMLLGCVQSLALELGLCDDGERVDVSAKPLGFKAEQTRLRDLLYIFLEQQSSRLGCPSMMPTSVSRFMSESSRRDLQCDSAIVTAWLDLTNLTRTIIDVLCPSAAGIREILSSCRYVNIIKHFQKQLAGWKTTYLSHDNLSFHAYEDLTIEFNYLRAFMNSFGIQAAVDRVLGRRPPNSIDTDVLQSSITATDYSFIKEVIDSSCQALESVNRLFETGTLRYCPVRVFLRIIMASIFLLKALSLGIRTTDLETSLGILERSIRALRNSNLDEMHLASRYGELLDMHLERYRQSMVPTTIPQGIRTVDQVSQWIFDTSVPLVNDALGDLSMAAVDDWLALPFDPSMAPFGFATDDPDMAEPEDRSWDFLWSLPNV
ncbi:ARO80-positive transcription regulator of ARO9 ARO10 [Fusarium mexicanum]|uniref:ARO80-positive transcription regulator of ARO9 ARO10 n=1 Tax=Fusarium mexicanum TaxID=751941 RepID=A0A8H5INX2_9HYPO|nr:ARO80-positive transcription regulator of ARO9 ARO10 [Fusarium mexicanum]